MATPPPIPPSGPDSLPRSSLGLDANLAAVLAYAGVFVTGIVLLGLEKNSRFVRFHAMQSTLTFLGVGVLTAVVNAVPFIGQVFSVLVIWPASVLLWGVLMLQAFRGRWWKLPFIGDIADKQIGP
jgi:uncharacterized membrane protein